MLVEGSYLGEGGEVDTLFSRFQYDKLKSLSKGS